MKTILLAAAATLVLSMSASAEDVSALHGRHVTVGDVNGSVYYTEVSDEFAVVATLSSGDSDRSIRTRANLRDGQSMTVEVPGRSGANTDMVTISRTGDTLTIEPQADLRAALDIK
ncbi:hypothetical protein U0C82_11430 [Fulvimarina sp. 2208YS6-2-32]|uniref:DUF5666 domain-containing protein n=1 Tax=Fulvimarina uroteuthidis TaxID=3098149 RepID=A0ABU5I3U0_9HYPH|nr:hypothetical protein [Fulvimarina sp. 2208YS6-2-32]MDY8109750.1 hypothetical protein [Fulvimarina sp. 2208YS6-2-32]